MASMVIAVNSVVGGACIALICALVAHAPSPLPAVVGVIPGCGLLALGLHYQQRRLIPVVLRSPAALDARGDSPEVT